MGQFDRPLQRAAGFCWSPGYFIHRIDTLAVDTDVSDERAALKADLAQQVAALPDMHADVDGVAIGYWR